MSDAVTTVAPARDDATPLPPQLAAIDRQMVAIEHLVGALVDNAHGATNGSIETALRAQIDSVRAQVLALAHTSQLIATAIKGERKTSAPAPDGGMPPTFGKPVRFTPSTGDADHERLPGAGTPLDRL